MSREVRLERGKMRAAECSRERVSLRERDTERLVSMLLDSTLPLSFWSKTYADLSGCWLWLAYRDRDGYGTFRIPGAGKKKAHRVAYEHFVGAIPEGKQLDHRCRNRACVNPRHLEPVTAWQNNHRSPIHCANKTHCKNGHAYDLINTLYSMGKRYCRTCKRQSERAFKARRRDPKVIVVLEGAE